jgi:signal transduction histidine kinase
MHCDKSGFLWTGSWGGNLNRLDPKTNQFRHYLDGHLILCFYEDTDLFLVGTDKGLYRYNKENDNFSIFIDREELHVINAIIEGDGNNVWIGTNSSIVKLDKENRELIVFGPKFGIHGNLTPGPNMKMLSTGEILKGTFDGFHYFLPEELTSKAVPARILVSDFSVNNHSVLPGKESPLNKPIGEVNEITLNHVQNSFSINFGSDDYRTPYGVRYYTMLDGYDKTWKEAVGDKSASYFYVDPDHYVFRVRIYNNDGIKTERAIAIHVLPPWWRTWWAYTIYVAVIVLLGYVLFRLQRARIVRLERQRTQAKELAQAKEIEKAYKDLKATQAQLIQSEKMASLGELTAGIAHEIQNPLNFVNNFSEVNTELIAEMKAELMAGNHEAAISLAKDIQENEQKINHHGKRADGIVKGMLQHSRTSSGAKESTDVNALADEYLRLAYHGLRAKNKSFNATMKTDFDATLGNINVIPQDIGRVILNLITNAFYAVTEKKQHLGDSFEPIVSVSTRKKGDRVEIRVQDNGNGIPQKVMEKIFQPFFTTKPTGQGTGLGLSLSYDIVKTHGGELKVETKEGEGAEFIILLPV